MTKNDVATNVHLKLRMEKPDLATYYSFPFFISDDKLYERKIPQLYFEYDGKLIQLPETIGISGEEMVQLAFAGLREKSGLWQTGELENGRPAFVSCTDAAAAVKILDASFLDEAGRLLHTDELAISIPHQELILAARLSDVKQNAAFLQAAKAGFNKIAAATLTDLIFIYKEGHITEIADLLKTVASSDDFAAFHVAEDHFLKITEIPVFTGDFFFKVEIGAPNDHQLLDFCERTIFHLLRKGLANAKFLGIIEFLINRDTNPYSTTLARRLADFWESLEASTLIRKLSTQLRRNIELSIVFGDHFSVGSVASKMYFKIEYHK